VSGSTPVEAVEFRAPVFSDFVKRNSFSSFRAR
jgi:hypothetical protein